MYRKTVTVIIIIIVVFCFVVITNLQGMIYNIPLFFFYLRAGFKPWIWRWRRNGVTGWNSKSLAIHFHTKPLGHFKFPSPYLKNVLLVESHHNILLLTTASSWVEGGCLGCPGASTVISQPLDSKTLPLIAIPEPWASRQGHPARHPSPVVGGKQKNNSYKKKQRLHNALSNVVPNSRYAETV